MYSSLSCQWVATLSVSLSNHFALVFLPAPLTAFSRVLFPLGCHVASVKCTTPERCTPPPLVDFIHPLWCLYTPYMVSQCDTYHLPVYNI